jgi:hypothetical protein
MTSPRQSSDSSTGAKEPALGAIVDLIFSNDQKQQPNEQIGREILRLGLLEKPGAPPSRGVQTLRGTV